MSLRVVPTWFIEQTGRRTYAISEVYFLGASHGNPDTWDIPKIFALVNARTGMMASNVSLLRLRVSEEGNPGMSRELTPGNYGVSGVLNSAGGMLSYRSDNPRSCLLAYQQNISEGYQRICYLAGIPDEVILTGQGEVPDLSKALGFPIAVNYFCNQLYGANLDFVGPGNGWVWTAIMKESDQVKSDIQLWVQSDLPTGEVAIVVPTADGFSPPAGAKISIRGVKPSLNVLGSIYNRVWRVHQSPTADGGMTTIVLRNSQNVPLVGIVDMGRALRRDTELVTITKMEIKDQGGRKRGGRSVAAHGKSSARPN